MPLRLKGLVTVLIGAQERGLPSVYTNMRLQIAFFVEPLFAVFMRAKEGSAAGLS